ncbi:hypothetical protein [Planktotalea arctica]|uniref:hypothetical protein n=1 Tax=Planktotalea arctica TaxID=1481893 RepID=UPI00321B4C24
MSEDARAGAPSRAQAQREVLPDAISAAEQDGLPQRPLFLGRRSYRQRRLLDAARLLPVIGLVLWLVPLIWPRAGAQGAIATSSATLYIFVIWYILIMLGIFLAFRMAPGDSDDLSDSGGDAEGGQSRNDPVDTPQSGLPAQGQEKRVRGRK